MVNQIADIKLCQGRFGVSLTIISMGIQYGLTLLANFILGSIGFFVMVVCGKWVREIIIDNGT